MTRQKSSSGLGQLRPFSQMELLFYHLIQAVYNGNSCDVIALEGKLDREILTRALKLWVSRHPVLNSVVVTRPVGRVFWRRLEEPLPLDVRFEKLDTDDEGKLHARLEHNAWGIQFDVAKERPIRFHYIEAPSRSYLQVVTARLYTDGRTGGLIVREISESYNAVARGEPFDTTPVDVEDRSNRLFLGHLPLRRRFQLWFSGMAGLLGDLLSPSVALAVPDVPRGPTKVQRVILGADRLRRVKSLTRRKHLTVHMVLALAFLRACEDFNQKRGVAHKPFRLLDSFSVRPFSRVPIDKLFDTVMLPYSMTVSLDQSDEAVMQQISDRLAQLKDGGILSFLYAYDVFLFLDRFLPKNKQRPWLIKMETSNVMLSNPGPIGEGIESMGDARVVDVINYSQLFTPVRLFVIVSTFRGVLRITVLNDSSAFPDGVSEIIDSFISHLDQLIASEPAEVLRERLGASVSS